MVGNPDVIKTLISAVSMERHLNLQCRQDSLSVKFMGAKKVAKKLNKFADEAHRFYGALTKRILFLEGNPSSEIAATVEPQSLTAVLQIELSLQMTSIRAYEQAIQIAMKALDDATRNLFEHLIKWKEDIVGWLETQLSLIKRLGEPEYLAEKL